MMTGISSTPSLRWAALTAATNMTRLTTSVKMRDVTGGQAIAVSGVMSIKKSLPRHALDYTIAGGEPYKLEW